jgi:hypothetical protein
MINVAGGTLRVINTTVTCNTATEQGGGAFNANMALILGSNLIADTTVPTGRTLFNASCGSITATNFNLFGFNGNYGFPRFQPGANDVVPPVGIQAVDILNPSVADNEGKTRPTLRWPPVRRWTR